MPTVKPRTVDVVIYQGDDLARIAELRRAADVAARNTAPSRIGDSTSAMDAARAYDEFVAEAAERAVVVKVQQLGRKEWRAVRDAHPPRPDNDEDAGVGVNVETIGDELVPVSIVAPEFPSLADRDAFLESLSEADFDRLTWAAYALNAQPVADPKGISLVSVLGQMSDESSRSSAPSA